MTLWRTMQSLYDLTCRRPSNLAMNICIGNSLSVQDFSLAITPQFESLLPNSSLAIAPQFLALLANSFLAIPKFFLALQTDSFLAKAPQFLAFLADSSPAKASLFPTLLAVGRITSNCLKQGYKGYGKKNIKKKIFLIIWPAIHEK